METTRHIKPLYVRARLNGSLVSKVLIDNGSKVNVMPLRMLRALRMSINDLIETEVAVLPLLEKYPRPWGYYLQISPLAKKLQYLPFCDRLYCKLQYFVREGLDSCQLVCAILFISSNYFGKVMK